MDHISTPTLRRCVIDKGTEKRGGDWRDKLFATSLCKRGGEGERAERRKSDDSPRRRQTDTFGGHDPSHTEAYLHCSTASSHSLTQDCVGWQGEIYGIASLVIQTLNTHTHTRWMAIWSPNGPEWWLGFKVGQGPDWRTHRHTNTYTYIHTESHSVSSSFSADFSKIAD